MSIESELAGINFRLMELHRRFEYGEYEEMNSLYSEDFQGRLFQPRNGRVENYDFDRIQEGNREAAGHYTGQTIDFIFSGLSILPQGDDQAAVSYQVSFSAGPRIFRALNLEVWRLEADKQWRMIRWYQEDGV